MRRRTFRSGPDVQRSCVSFPFSPWRARTTWSSWGAGSAAWWRCAASAAWVWTWCCLRRALATWLRGSWGGTGEVASHAPIRRHPADCKDSACKAGQKQSEPYMKRAASCSAKDSRAWHDEAWPWGRLDKLVSQPQTEQRPACPGDSFDLFGQSLRECSSECGQF